MASYLKLFILDVLWWVVWAVHFVSPKGEVNLTPPFGQLCRAGQGQMSNACGSSSLWRPVLYSCVACYWETWALDVREQLGQRGLQQGWLCREKPATDSFCTRHPPPPPRPLCFQYKTAISKFEVLLWRGSKDTLKVYGGKGWKSVLLDSGLQKKNPLCWSPGLRYRKARGWVSATWLVLYKELGMILWLYVLHATLPPLLLSHFKMPFCLFAFVVQIRKVMRHIWESKPRLIFLVYFEGK